MNKSWNHLPRIRSRESHPFLVIEENRFAYAAVMQLRTAEPSRACRLVTVSGPSGVGKTHLARELVRSALTVNPQLIETHVTAAEFADEFISASQARCIPEFQSSYRRCELLVIEDIQVLEGRPETVQQLLGTIDEILARGGRILLTCHKPPGELQKVSSKLISRCHGGVCAEVKLPNRASRTTLLDHFASAMQFPIPEDVLRFLAKKLNVSPRELFGILAKLQAVSSERHEPLTLETAAMAVQDMTETAQPTIEEITRFVAGEFDVPVETLISQGRMQNIVSARQTAMFLGRKLAKLSFKSIGDYFNGRNHATVIHACRKANRQLQQDREYAQRIRNIIRSLRSHGFRLGEEVVRHLSATGSES